MQIQVEAEGDPDDLKVWRLHVPDGREPAIAVTDAGAAVASESRRESDMVVVELVERPTGPVRLTLDYGRRRGEALHRGVHCQEHFATIAGEALPLPEKLVSTSLPVALDVQHTTRSDYRAASSLGLGGHHKLNLGLRELRQLNILVGDLATAQFDSQNGRDDVASLGYTSFDMRWVAAETAGVRTVIDQHIGLVSQLAFTVLMVSDFYPQQRDLKVHLRTASLWLDLNAHREWGAHPRLSVAQTLTGRWLGGQLRVREPDQADIFGLWFDLGFSRYVAREVLFSLGTLDIDEYAADLNRAQAEWATSRFRGKSPSEVEVPTPGSMGERALQVHMMSRGELAAAYLDATLRSHGATLPRVLSQLVATARERNSAVVQPKVVNNLLRQHLAADELARFWQIVAGATPPPVDMGPCFRPKKTVFERYALGFVAGPGDQVAGEPNPQAIAEIDPDGPAYRAGLRATDRLLRIEGDSADPQKPVTLTVEFEGETRQLRYRPLGGVGRGVRYQKRANIDPGLCPRWEL